MLQKFIWVFYAILWFISFNSGFMKYGPLTKSRPRNPYSSMQNMKIVAFAEAVLVSIAIWTISSKNFPSFSISGGTDMNISKKVLLPRNVLCTGYFDSWFEIASQVRNKSASIAMARYADGEYFVMHGNDFISVDYFKYQGGDTLIKKQMLQSLTGQYGKNYYYGHYAEYPSGFHEFIPQTEADISHFTFANLWINSNYAKTREFLKELIYEEYGEIILLINERARKTTFAKETIKFPTDLNSIWVKENKKILGNLENLARKYNNKLFMVSVGPFAKVMIWVMFNANPNNRYIDFGSALMTITGMPGNRPYFPSKSPYRWQIEPQWYINDNGTIIVVPPKKNIIKKLKRELTTR